jgi:hypothetical protein
MIKCLKKTYYFSLSLSNLALMKEYRLKNIENNYQCEEMSIKQSLEVFTFVPLIKLKIFEFHDFCTQAYKMKKML